MLAVTTAHADVFKYTDKRGRVYLTDQPPHQGYRLLIKTWKGWEERKSPGVNTLKHNQSRFKSVIKQAAQKHGLPHTLLHAVITAESSYDPNALSKAGAVGLMQLMPGTAKRYGVSNRRDPVANIRGGSHYLRDLLTQFDNNVVLALAAYNAGENAVIKYGNKIPPYKETRNYVNKVLKYYKKYKTMNI